LGTCMSQAARRIEVEVESRKFKVEGRNPKAMMDTKQRS